MEHQDKIATLAFAPLYRLLAKKDPELMQGKIFISPDEARRLGVVDCYTCADEGLITVGTDVRGCPDCNS